MAGCVPQGKRPRAPRAHPIPPGLNALPVLISHEQVLALDQLLQVRIETRRDHRIAVRIMQVAHHLAHGAARRGIEIQVQHRGAPVVAAVREAQALAHRQVGIDAGAEDVGVFLQPFLVDRADALAPAVPLGGVFEDLFDDRR